MDCQSAIHAIKQQKKENYHNITISNIRKNLIEIHPKVKSVKLIYCPVHKGIKENETADEQAKVAPTKAKNHKPTCDITTANIKEENSKLTLTKWQRRSNNSRNNLYKDIVPTLCKKSLKQRLAHLKFTSIRRRASKITRLKSGHSMLKGHKNKTDPETKSICKQCKVEETPSRYLLHCKLFEEPKEG